MSTQHCSTPCGALLFGGRGEFCVGAFCGQREQHREQMFMVNCVPCNADETLHGASKMSSVLSRKNTVVELCKRLHTIA